MTLRLVSGFAAIALALGCAPAAQAQDGEWNFRIAPYLMIPSMDGPVTLRGYTADANVGPGEILDRLNMGFMGFFEASNDQWGVNLDVIYMNLDADDDSRIVNINVKQSAITSTAFYRVSPNVDLYAGARFNDIGGEFIFQGPLGLPEIDKDKSWIDPLIGVRYHTPLGDKWNFEMMADVGGVVTGSKIAIDIWPMVGYEVSDHAQLGFGYRLLYMDYESGSGNTLFQYDVLTAGPVVGLALDF